VDYAVPLARHVVRTARSSLVVNLVLLTGLTVVGCTHSASLPPSVSMTTPQAGPKVGNLNQPVPPPGLPTNRVSGQSPWKPSAAPRDWKHIVIHHTATGTGSVESIHAAHLKNKDKSGNPWLGIGYHFVIGNGEGMADGAIEPTFRWRTQIQGAHAGSANKDFNERGIGICLVGNFEKSPPTPAQKRSVKLLVQTLRQEYRIPATEVVGHKDIRASSTECPGKLFPMAEVAAAEFEQMLGLDEDGVPLVRIASTSGSKK
jgi:hypothetical protein